jgi:hypothetical protein
MEPAEVTNSDTFTGHTTNECVREGEKEEESTEGR